MGALEEAIDRISDQLEEYSFLDKPLLEKDLICNICNKPLNVVPIVYNENIGSICGRCSSATSLCSLGAILRQHAYESLIKNLTFPCTNKSYGCTEILKFIEVQEHEKNCKFHSANCPLYFKQLFPGDSCSWIGSSKLVLDHLKKHQDLFLDPPMFEWHDDKQNKVFFTTLSNQIITVAIRHEKDSKYICSVMFNGTDIESQCYRYQLELANEEKTNSLILRRNRLDPLANLLDNLNRPDTSLEVDLDKISGMLHDTKKVIAKFGIVKKNKREIMQITGSRELEIVPASSVTPVKEKVVPLDEDMLAELECPVCNEYMIPPIFICATGHSVCSECKHKVSQCPSCRCAYANGRNFTLEKLTLKVMYPCRNREIGCGFVTTSDKIKQHQNTCELTENPCVFRCGWKGLATGLYNHFLEKHSNFLIGHNDSIMRDVNQDKNGGHYFIYHMGDLFRLTFKNSGKNAVRFSLQQVGYFDLEPKYKYTINFTPSPTLTCPALSLTNYCQPWDEDLNKSLTLGMTVHADLLKNFVFQNHIYYIKIFITKI